MGIVYRAVDPTGREVAVKCLAARDEETARRLLREAGMRVVHRNVARVLGAGLGVRGDPYVVTELLEGESFLEWLTRGGSIDETVMLMAQAAEGLAALHVAGVVHRDVKPSNLFVTRQRTLKVLDFGAAAFADQKSLLTVAGAFVGTPAYLSPEQAGGGEVDGRADVWGLGMCLYHAFTGHLPFARGTPGATAFAVQHDSLPPLAERAPSIPPDLARLVEQCLEKRREDRVQTAAALAQRLWAHWGAERPTLEARVSASFSFEGAASEARGAKRAQSFAPAHGSDPSRAALGPFVLEEQAGRGGMAVVYRARHPDGTRVAVKIPSIDAANAPRFVAAFHEEARAIAALDHPAVVRLYDYGVVSEAAESATGGALRAGVPWIALEWASGGTLEKRPQPSSWSEARATLTTILEALAHVHARGIVHRDLKPANVLVSTEADGTTGLRLTDFGFVLGRSSTARLQGGTPAYMAPEQWEGRERDQGPWTDLYALGVLAWRLVTGALPNEPAGGAFAPTLEVPAGLHTWLRSLLAPSHRARFQRAAEALHALHDLDVTHPHRPPFPRSWQALARPNRPFPANVGRGVVHLRPIPIAGRAREREVLWTALGEVIASHRPQAIALIGSAGIGKTRLLQWLEHGALELGVADVAHVTHHAQFEPDDGIVAMLARQIGVDRLAGEELDPALADALPSLPRDDRDALATLLAGLVPLERGQTHDRRTLVAGALASFQRGRPLVLTIDDAQWGEEAIELAKDLLDLELPLLVVLAARDDALEERPLARTAADSLLSHERASQMPILPLSGAEHADLVRHFLGLEATAALLIGERTGGNPGFAIELVADCLRGDILYPSSEGFRLAYPDPALPADLAAAWRARVDRVLRSRQPDDAGAMEIAALLGEICEDDVWTAACAAAGIRPSPDLIDAFAKERLVRRLPNGQWAFAHGMLREAMLALAEQGDIAARHRACIEALRGREGREARLGWHLLMADRPAEAIEPLLAAIDRAWASTDYPSAAAALAYAQEAAARLPPSSLHRGAVRLRAVMAAKWTTRYEDVTHECEALIADIERYGWRGLEGVWSYLADMRHRSGDYPGAFAALDAGGPGAGALAGTGWRRAFMLVELGRLDEAEAAAEALIADPEARRWDLVTAHRVVAIVLRQRGRPLEAVRRLEKTLELARGLRWHVAQTLSDLGDIHRAAGDLEEADRYYSEACDRFRALAAPHNIAVVEVNRAVVSMLREAWAEAIEIVSHAVPVLERRGRLPALAGAHAVGLVARAAREEWEEFDLHAERVEAQFEAAKCIDTDLLECFERAASIADAAGEGARAARMSALAADQRQALSGSHHRGS